MKYPLAARTTLVALVGLCSIHRAPAAPETAGVSFSPPGVYGGAASTGTIRLPAAAPRGGLSVALASDNPQAVTIPASVTVPAGAKVVRFRLQALPVAVITDVVITATAGRDAQSGADRTAARQTARFRIAPPTAGWVKFSPNMVPAGAASTGTVFLTGPAPEGGQRVLLVSRDPALVSVPDSITVPAGGTSVTFPVQTGPTRIRVGVTVVAGVGGADKSASSILGILPGTPAAPTGLSATPQWDPHCDPCGGMPEAEVTLAWNAVSGASAYTVYRDNAPLQTGVATPAFTDMTVVSGQVYSYAVTAIVNGAESPKSLPATVTAPDPPADLSSSMTLPPANLGVRPLWNNGSNDVLSWTPVFGANSYNVYQYEVKIASGLTQPTYTVTAGQFLSGAPYSITSVDANGMESIQSQIATAIGGLDPNNLPSWAGPWIPGTPETPTATAELNDGKPRILLTWQHVKDGVDVYRDGQKIAEGLWAFSYVDTDVKPGETHSYTIAGVNPYNPNRPVGAQSASVASQAAVLDAAQAMRAARTLKPGVRLASFHGHARNYLSRSRRPGGKMARNAADAGASPGSVQILQVVPNDDSALIVFAPVPGAADYRVYEAGKPEKAKYCGQFFSYPTSWFRDPATRSIEWNGIDPAKGVTLVVEAVDKIGPFQKMDAVMESGIMPMTQALNGQGNPSNVPGALARSAPFHVDCKPVTFGKNGQQVFFDTFRNSQTFTPTAHPDPKIVAAAGANQFTEFENDKWVIRDYQGDTANSKVFVMDNHLMDTLYDGGGPNARNIPVHNNNATMMFLPKATADIGGGKVLHVTFEVDAHANDRRWCNLWVMGEGDQMLFPGKSIINGNGDEVTTSSGNAFVWDIHAGSHEMNMLVGGSRVELMQATSYEDRRSFERTGFDGTPEANGTAFDLDKRHRFDLYLSANRYRIEERNAEGGLLVSREKIFPAGVTLPFTRCRVLFGHEVYHTGNDRSDNVQYRIQDAYWINHRGWADERHWDNMGQEVLDAFPV